jgi:hypothetical protein
MISERRALRIINFTMLSLLKNNYGTFRKKVWAIWDGTYKDGLKLTSCFTSFNLNRKGQIGTFYHGSKHTPGQESEKLKEDSEEGRKVTILFVSPYHERSQKLHLINTVASALLSSCRYW